MVAHFDFPTDLPLDLPARLNQLLPSDIRIQQVQEVAAGAHARFSATQRLYRYYIHRYPDPFRVDRSWFVHALPHINLLNMAAPMLLKQTDFGCFAKTHGGNQTNECKVDVAEWCIRPNELIFTIQANRFLRQMVRAIVGSLVAIAQGRKNMDWWTGLLQDSPQRKCGLSAPPQGLFLEKVAYPDSIFPNRNLSSVSLPTSV
jgi:tRNA pseudouridine38-40 synthase